MPRSKSNENNDDEEIGAEVEEYVNRLLRLYERKSKDFERYFGILVGISLFLLFFLILPYVITQHEKQYISNRYGVASDVLNIIDTLNKTHTGIDKLQHDIGDFYNNITSFYNINQTEGKINLLKEYRNDSALFAKCPPNTDKKSMLSKCFSHIASELNQNLTKNVNGPVILVDSTSLPKLIHASNLVQELKDLSDKLHIHNLSKIVEIKDLSNYLHGPNLMQQLKNLSNILPTVISTAKGNAWNASAIKNLRTKTLDFGDDFHTKRLDPLANEMGVSTDNRRLMNLILTNLNSTNTEVNNTLHDIEGRLNQFESPIGKLTIGFNDIVLSFPIALASGFLVCMYLLRQAIHFRMDFFHYYPMKYKGKQLLNNKDLIRIAPLWLDPEDLKQNKKIRFLIVLLPVGVFVASCGLIFYSFSISTPESSLVSDYVNRSLYQITIAILYFILGLLFFIYSFKNLFGEYDLQGN